MKDAAEVYAEGGGSPEKFVSEQCAIYQ